MTKQIVDIGPAEKKIVNTGKTMPRIDPAQLAAALGAEPVPDSQIIAAGPLSRMAVRQETARRLQSNEDQAALPLSNQERQKLEAIAAALAKPGCTPSASQVASALLNLALDAVLVERTTETAAPPITKDQLRARLAEVDAKS